MAAAAANNNRRRSEWTVSLAGAIKIFLVVSGAIFAFGSLNADVKGNRKDIDRNTAEQQALNRKIDERFDRLTDKMEAGFNALNDKLTPGR